MIRYRRGPEREAYALDVDKNMAISSLDTGNMNGEVIT